jgi:hypothetical protein
MKRRRARPAGVENLPAKPNEASSNVQTSERSDDEALLALLACSLEARARHRDDDLPLELAAADLLRACLSASALADSPTREVIAQTARREFDKIVKPTVARSRSRAA